MKNSVQTSFLVPSKICPQCTKLKSEKESEYIFRKNMKRSCWPTTFDSLQWLISSRNLNKYVVPRLLLQGLEQNDAIFSFIDSSPIEIIEKYLIVIIDGIDQIDQISISMSCSEVTPVDKVATSSTGVTSLRHI
jgi:hypothetical protein